jgi:hypothetical protein
VTSRTKTIVGDAVNATQRLESLGKMIDPDAESIALISGEILPPASRNASYVQMWSPLLTISLAASICLGVLSFIMGQAKPHP